MHHLEMVIEGPSYAKNVKAPQLRLMHDLRHLDSESLPGSDTQLQTGVPTNFTCRQTMVVPC